MGNCCSKREVKRCSNKPDCIASHFKKIDYESLVNSLDYDKFPQNNPSPGTLCACLGCGKILSKDSVKAHFDQAWHPAFVEIVTHIAFCECCEFSMPTEELSASGAKGIIGVTIVLDTMHSYKFKQGNH